MGYRSDIYIAVKEKDYENLMRKITTDEVKKTLENEFEHKDDYDELIWLLSEGATISRNCFEAKDYLEIYLKQVKWTPAVDYIRDWLDELDDFELVVIGEYLDDIEHITSKHYAFYNINRCVERNT